ncbi:SH3 domain-binding glutamic acid-rich protein homolog [Gryllus bimaculatus]|nr:SH3 domain-binding glutamic acid-rich protein homolog [Gryllus bimaculatus]
MVVKVYISGISGNKEVKKHQQRVMMILDSKNIEYVVVDITEPGKESDKEFMQKNSNAKDSKYPLPPQMFNEEEYCGDYEDFDLANEVDDLERFLKLSPSVSKAEITLEPSAPAAAPVAAAAATEAEEKAPVENGVSSSRENSSEKEVAPKSEEQADGDAATKDESEEANEEE